MKVSHWIAISITAVALGGTLLGAAYWAGFSHGGEQQAALTPGDPAADQAPAPLRPSVEVPVGHPPLAAAGLPPPASPQAGVAGADPSAHFTHFRVGERNVKGFVADGDIMWVGTSAGVIRYDTQSDQYRLFDVRSGLLANGVFHLSRLDGRLAVGTYGGGLALMNDGGEGWELFNIPEGLADAFVYDLLKADNGDVWIATWSGANRVHGGALKDPERWQTYTVANTDGGLPNDWVYAMEQGQNGVIWFATEGGLARYDGERWQNWRHQDGLGAPYDQVREQIRFKNDPAQFSDHHARQKIEMGLEQVDVAYNPNYIVALAVDGQGGVWCGTWGGGLARYDGETWRNFTVADGLPGNHVFMLYQDAQRRLWIGTNDGLARREPDGSFKVFTVSDGLYANSVFAMTTAADGSYWVGSFGGVARIASLP